MLPEVRLSSSFKWLWVPKKIGSVVDSHQLLEKMMKGQGRYAKSLPMVEDEKQNARRGGGGKTGRTGCKLDTSGLPARTVPPSRGRTPGAKL